MNIVRGDAYEDVRRLVATVTDPAGALVDLTGSSVRFVVKAHPTSDAALILKSTSDGIVLADQVASKGVAYIALSSTDTDIPAGAYYFELEATDAIGVITLAGGRIWVAADLMTPETYLPPAPPSGFTAALEAYAQPLDSDLTAIAALATTTFGRSLLTAASAAALRALAGTVIGTDVAAFGDARLSDARTPAGAAGGDLSGTYPNPAVVDDSHAHTAATLPAGTGAPTGADYLVATTQGGLSAEIVVGTSPGGELGGTWASPTIDASHSGSTHAATEAAAEATAAAALASHEADTTSIHGIADTSALYRIGGTDVAVADGGTGASTAAGARTGLGLVIGTDVRAQGSGDPVERAAASTTPAAIGTAAVGVGTTDARADHVHATGAGTPVTQAFADSAAAGSGPAAAMTDHKHGMPANPVAYGAPGLTLGTANAAGAASSAVRTDATIRAFDATVPTTSAEGDAAAVGAATVAARRDHLHGREAFGASAAAVGTSSAGAATTPSRSDHVHASGAGTPSTQALGDAAATGSGPAASMTDHKHAMPALSAATPLIPGTAAVGTALPSSREDHVHPGPIDVYIGADPVLMQSAAIAPGGANAAHVCKFRVLRPATVTKGYARITVASGNVDMGIYSSDGTTLTRVGSSGSTACPTAADNANVALTGSVSLVPGVIYYAAFAANNATAQALKSGFTPMFVGTGAGDYAGYFATSFPLPATLTLSSMTHGQVWGCQFK